MKKKTILFTLVILLILIFSQTVFVTSDDNYEPQEEWDNHKMHFPQLPNPLGWDVDFWDWSLADDWQCSENGSVTGIHFWISWYFDAVLSLQSINVSIWSDNPGGPFSYPEIELWNRTFYEQDYVVSESMMGDQGWYTPDIGFELTNHFQYFQIDIENITDPFYQTNGTIYWLVIETLAFQEPFIVGWKTSLDWWNDNAVYGYPGAWLPLEDPLTLDPINFAFVITGEDEEEEEEEPTWNHKMHYPQYPDPNGWDVMSAFYEWGDGPEIELADDWMCTETGNVTDIHIWGSWDEDNVGIIDGFWLTIYSDIPANESGTNYSMPDVILWQEYVTDFEITQMEPSLQGYLYPDWFYDLENHLNYSRYDFVNFSSPFWQEKGTIYWLGVMPAINISIESYWGWKTTLNPWHDEAVYREFGMVPMQEWVNLTDPITNQTLDLAFVITGEGEQEDDDRWNETHKMHFPQLPDPFGWDVDFYDMWLADDWMCSETGNVTDIHFWISWIDDMNYTIPWINISIWSDNPVGEGGYSEPLEELWQKNFSDSEFEVTLDGTGLQGFYLPDVPGYEEDNHNNYYLINITNIQEPFNQTNGTIYWLVIDMPLFEEEPLPPMVDTLVGWKTSTDHWNDAAVWGYLDQPLPPMDAIWYNLSDPITGEPLDFAFVITNEEEKYEEVYVDDDALPGWYDGNHVHTIQEGNDVVEQNGTIYVYNGTYDEQIVIDTSTSLVGESRDGVIINCTNSPVFSIDSDFVNIFNISFIPLINPNYIIVSAYNKNITINNCYIDRGHRHVYLENAGYIGIYDSYFNFTSVRSIEAINTTMLEIINCEFNIVDADIYYTNVTYSNIFNCKTNDALTGMELLNSSYLNIDNYTHTGRGANHAIKFKDYTNNATISNCSITNTLRAIYFYNAVQDVNIFGNNLFDNDYGMMFLLENKDLLIFDNNVSNSSIIGILFGFPGNPGFYSNDSIIYHNNLFNNTENANDTDSSNTWYDSISQEGNYWDNYDEPSEGAWDNNSDLIADDPYTVPGDYGNQDLYPLVNLSGWLMYPPWDINQDGVVNYLDVSLLVNHYGDTGTPGWIPEDINQDGIVNYLDVSLLVNHYGESYL